MSKHLDEHEEDIDSETNDEDGFEMPTEDEEESQSDDEQDGEEEESEDVEESEEDESEEEDSDEESEEEDDEEDDAEPDNSYRPSAEEEVKKPETVPLKKYLKAKKDLKEARESSASGELDDDALEEFAKDSGLEPKVVKNLATIIVKQANQAAVAAAEEKIKPIVQEKTVKASEAAFAADFQKTIVSKYPELASKEETFKKMAFSKDFLHLKSLDDIRKEFFPDVKQTSKKVIKKKVVEKGSRGGGKETERIEFATLADNPKQYAKVMKNPEARAKYYAWQDAQN